VLVVDCQEATQLRRVVARSGWAAADVQAVIAQQASREQRRASADAVIFNDTITEAQLADEVRAIWQRWTAEPA
jgi:dephospho-CoA kinase